MKLSKINTEILNLCRELVEIQNYDPSDDFQIYDGYITANIKSYDFLDEDDVLKALEETTQNWENFKDEALEEFCDERLFGIVNHANKYEIEYFKDGPNLCHNTDLILDSEDIWQFGRNGGHLSFIQKSVLEEFEDCVSGMDIYDLDYCLNEDTPNKEFNRYLNEEMEISYYGSKQEFIKVLKEEIQAFEDKLNAVREIEEMLEKWAKNMKDTYLDQLSTKLIDYFYSTDICLNTIRIEDDLIRTNWGANVPLREGEALVSYLNTFVSSSDQDSYRLDLQIGHFTVNRLYYTEENGWIVKIGCHRIALDHANEVLNNA